MAYKRILELREIAELSQKQIAENIHMHKTTYARYETGEREIPLNMRNIIASAWTIWPVYPTKCGERPPTGRASRPPLIADSPTG